MVGLFLPLFTAGVLMGPVVARATGPILDLSLTDSTMSADMDDRPLNEVLRLMAEKGIIRINGPAPGGELLTLHFRRLTLDRALPKIMRGYNYVLTYQGKARAPLLTVMGKIVWGRPDAFGTTEAPPPPPEAADSRSYVPPEPPRQLPIGKDGQPVPHWTDDDGRVHITGEEETPKTQATEAGQKQGSEQQQDQGLSGQSSDPGSTGVSAKNQASDPTP
jgi:hypothetical protein